MDTCRVITENFVLEPTCDNIRVSDVVEDQNPDCLVVVYSVDDLQSFGKNIIVINLNIDMIIDPDHIVVYYVDDFQSFGKNIIVNDLNINRIKDPCNILVFALWMNLELW